MLTYTYSTKLSSQPDPRGHSTRHAAYAREAVFEEFSPRAARALDHDGFRDRKPHEGPRHIGDVAAKVTHGTDMKALRHWLNEAGRADTDEERQAALKIAGEIAQLMGLDLFEKEAA